MKAIRRLGLAASLAALIHSSAHAAEGGTGHYMPGSLATLIDLPPTQPGWVVEAAYLHYEGHASADIPVAGLDTARLDVDLDSALLGAFYTVELPWQGFYYTVGSFLPFAWVDATAQVRGAAGRVRRSDSESGFSDLTVIPVMLAWKQGSWQFDALVPIYAPTGEYERGRLANPGLNYWSFDPTIGFSYNDEKTGFNAAFHAGVMFNTENHSTDYDTGDLFHVEASVQQLLPVGPGFVAIGAEAFYLDQINPDNGAPDILGDFERRSSGVGPVLSYVLPLAHGAKLAAEVRWLPELDTDNQLDGDYVWVKAVYQF